MIMQFLITMGIALIPGQGLVQFLIPAPLWFGHYTYVHSSVRFPGGKWLTSWDSVMLGSQPI
jgi:hypothetical protein